MGMVMYPFTRQRGSCWDQSMPARFKLDAERHTFIDYTFNPPVDVSAFTSFFVGLT